MSEQKQYYCPNCGPQKEVNPVGGLGELYGFTCLTCDTAFVTQETPPFVLALQQRIKQLEAVAEAARALEVGTGDSRIVWHKFRKALRQALQSAGYPTTSAQED